MKRIQSVICIGVLLFSLSGTGWASQAGVAAERYRNPDAHRRLPLTEGVRASSAKLLGSTLAEIIAHSRAVQQMHWNVQGPLFYPLHDLLGEFYDALNAQIDEIAERKRALGMPADGRPSHVAGKADLGDVPAGIVTDREALDVLTKGYLTLSTRLQKRIARTNNDLVTQGMLLELAAMVEKQLWLLRSFYSADGKIETRD